MIFGKFCRVGNKATGSCLDENLKLVDEIIVRPKPLQSLAFGNSFTRNSTVLGQKSFTNPMNCCTLYSLSNTLCLAD